MSTALVFLEQAASALVPNPYIALALDSFSLSLLALFPIVAFFHHCGNRYLQSAYDLILGRVASLRIHLAIRAVG